MTSSRRRRGLGAIALSSAAALVFSALPAGAAHAATGPADAALTASRPVIVVLANQYASLPDTAAGHTARRSAMASAQAPLLSTLNASGARNVRALTVLNAVSATVSGAEEQALRADPAVSEIVPDSAIKVQPGLTLPVPTAASSVGSAKTGSGAGASAKTRSVTLPAGTCAANGGVQLDPEALEAIHADSDVPGARTARSLGFTGSGVTVGDIATEMDVNTPEMIRPDGSRVIQDYQDFTGEGGDVMGPDEIEGLLDDGMIAAQGDAVYNLQDYTASALGQPCLIRLEGVSPGVTLDAYKVYGEDDYTTTSAFLEAIDYAVTVDHVNVLNEEAGSFPMPDTSADLIKTANAAAIAAGVTITVPSYDAGDQNTIWSPASQPGVIAVGASTTFRSYAQADTDGYREIGATGYVSDNISSLSSGGATEQGRSISVVAPGDLDWMICTADATLAPDCTNTLGKPSPVLQEGGTSEAGPLVAGVAALVIQAYRSTHGGASPAPALVDQLIESTADDLDVVGSEQGSGLVDAYRAVEAAMSVRTAAGSPKPVGDTLTASADQFDSTGAPGATQHFSTKLTNTGSSTQTVSLGARTLGPSHVVADKTVALADGGASYVDQYGYTNTYLKVRFTVPAGQDRLDANIAWPGTGQAPVNLALLDPSGKFTAYSLPNGNGNHGHVDVREPAAGTWTAVVSDSVSSQGGYTGGVQFDAAVARFAGFGSVSPSSVTLRPGQSAAVSVTARDPQQAGDLSASLTFGSPQSGRSSIPMTLRTEIPISHGTGSFSADIQGGNGRGYVPAQTEFYTLQVPGGEPALDVKTALADGRTDPYYVYLVAPDGSNPARGSNQTLEGTGTDASVVATPGAEAHVLEPEAGQWTVIVTFTNPVSGDALDTTLSGKVSFSGVDATAAGVPHGSTLTRGKAATVTVTVHNSSQGIESYFLDPRLDKDVTLHLVSTTPTSDLTLPLSYSNAEPQWIVPTRTTALGMAVTSTAPVQFDTSPYNGEPDIGSTAVGDDAYAAYSAGPTGSVTQGDWDIVPEPTGAYGASGAAPDSTASLYMTAVTKGFNADAASDAGDLWQQSVDPSAPFAPVVVQPGGTAKLTLTITPAEARGALVSGVLYLDDSSSLSNNGASPAGDELAAFPYEYRVG